MAILQERWADIEGFNGKYKISDKGRVKSMKRRKAKILKSFLTGSTPYPTIALCNGTKKNFKIHRLVARYFVENPSGNIYVNHKDGNKSNNIYSNLEWCSASENAKHAYATGLKVAPAGEKHYRSKLKEKDIRQIRELRASGKTQNWLAEKFNVSRRNIRAIINSCSWKSLT